MTKLKYFAILAILAMLLAGCVPVPASVTPTQAPAQPAAAAPVTADGDRQHRLAVDERDRSDD